MVTRFLVTTALEETWPDHAPVLFLGEWCRRYGRKEKWEPMDAAVLPYHWDDRERLHRDYSYLKELHESLLLELTAQLNRIHGVEHSLRYWRILVGPWLGYFVQMVFDRWSSIMSAVASGAIDGTVVLTGLDRQMIPNDMTHFHALYADDLWNHYIFAQILTGYTSVHCIPTEFTKPKAPAVQQSSGMMGLLKELLVGAYSVLANRMVRDDDAFFMTTYLPWREDISAQFRLRQFPQRWSFTPCVEVEPDFASRQWQLRDDDHGGFEGCIRALIVGNLPTCYLEGYQKLAAQVADQKWPKRPKLIFSSNAFNSDDVFKLWAAEKMEQGSVLVSGQHGGHYGTGWAFNEEHEIAISHYYLTWGWTIPGNKKVISFGQLKNLRSADTRVTAKSNALLVTCTMPQYSYCLYSVMISSQWLHYFDQQCRFVNGLQQPVRRALTVRLYSMDYGWSQKLRWRDRCPEALLDQGQVDMGVLMRDCRLYISSYNATTYLESLSMGIPTIVYWEPKHWELRETAIPYFQELSQVGIFHGTPESAAAHVNAIWDDVEGWWKHEDVQRVVARFKNEFVRPCEQRAKKLSTLFLGMVKHNFT